MFERSRYFAMFRGLLARRPVVPAISLENRNLVYDFSSVDHEGDDDARTLWDQYARACYSHDPPIPALSLMRPILFGDQTSALFAHQQIARHLPIILDALARSKMVTELDISDNSLTADVVQPLIAFVTDSDQLSELRFQDNPLIGARGMQELLEGLREGRALETITFSNTGCNSSVGHSIAVLLSETTTLLNLDASRCQLRQSVIEISQALPNCATLKRLNLSNNDLHYGQRKLALQLGSNVAKCTALSRLDLSQNALSSDMVASLLRGLGDAQHLHWLNLSRNEIGEPAGRAIATFLARSSSVRKLDISQNPILNVTRNRVEGQKLLEESNQKPGGGDKKGKSKVYTPACFLIAAALAKTASLKEVKMYGLVVNPLEWEQKLEPIGNRVAVLYRSPDAESFNFRPRTGAIIFKPNGQKGTPITPRR
jgi:hypothetical protein